MVGPGAPHALLTTCAPVPRSHDERQPARSRNLSRKNPSIEFASRLAPGPSRSPPAPTAPRRSRRVSLGARGTPRAPCIERARGVPARPGDPLRAHLPRLLSRAGVRCAPRPAPGPRRRFCSRVFGIKGSRETREVSGDRLSRRPTYAPPSRRPAGSRSAARGGAPASLSKSSAPIRFLIFNREIVSRSTCMEKAQQILSVDSERLKRELSGCL